jgi:hypothetical protein
MEESGKREKAIEMYNSFVEKCEMDKAEGRKVTLKDFTNETNNFCILDYNHKEKSQMNKEDDKNVPDYRYDNMAKDIDGLESCIICDLDGTLVIHTGRAPLEFERIHEDTIDYRLRFLLTMVREHPKGPKIIFITGRPENVREQTEEWLNNFFGGEYILIMRPERQFGLGNAVKKELYEKYIKGKYNVLCVFEDSDSCVEMWRNEGFLTLQVQNTDY